MNRIIKFREWSEGKMDYLPLAWCESINEVFEGGDTETPAIYMQFTGLIDKNGTEIYEGDIVKRGSHVMEIHYPDCFDSESIYSIYVPSNWEVIGNIYENPELLTPPNRV